MVEICCLSPSRVPQQTARSSRVQFYRCRSNLLCVIKVKLLGPSEVNLPLSRGVLRKAVRATASEEFAR